MSGQAQDNIRQIKEQIDARQKDTEDVTGYLTEAAKSRDLRRDFEAQKFIVQQLYELEVYEEAEKLCRRLLRRRPNDAELQSLHMKLRQAEASEQDLTPFEKNRRIIERVKKTVEGKIVGLEDFINELSINVQNALLSENQLHSYKELLLLSSPRSQGVKTVLAYFFEELEKYSLLEKGGVTEIDLPKYSSDSKEAQNDFLTDMYNAFKGKGQVTVFKNIDQCPQHLVPSMNEIVSQGKISLDGRYVHAHGGLNKVHDSLVSGSFDSIEAKDQFIIFQTHESIEEGLSIFTTTSRRRLSNQITIERMSDLESTLLFDKIFEEYIKRIDRNLHVHLELDKLSFGEVIPSLFRESGAIGLTEFAERVYGFINRYFVEHVEQIDEQWEVAHESGKVVLRGDLTTIELLTLVQEDNSLAKIEEKINNLIGLDDVKESLDQLKLYIENQRRRAERGLSSDLIGVHFLFQGNPGTGKTVVARLVAEYLKAVGYLSEGHLVEVDRSGLVGEYIGHTATKTMAKVEAAMGGVLFVDEAYSLARGGETDFGREAVDALVKAMEDHQGKFVIIFAGYPKEMDDFLETNPGLKSRISQTFTFADYTSQEMVDIAKLIASGKGYTIEKAALEQLPEYFNQHQIKGRTDGGNGRLARQVIESAVTKQAARILRTGDMSDEEQDLLRLDDFGFVVEEPFDLEAELSPIIGLSHVKDMVRTLHRQQIINKRRQEINPSFTHEQTLNYIFTGNPGTGKTTIARIIAELFKNINILKKGHLVEVSRGDLVAGHVGQTAIKTEQVFRRALGGVLFIDEAYALASSSSNDFGKEAVDTLIKLIEDHRGDICVILAGYDHSMKEFLQMNEGIQSRFTDTLHFADYTSEELVDIANHIITDKGFNLTEKANELLADYYTRNRASIDGNGRHARNTVETLIQIQSERLYTLIDFADEDLLTITEEDITQFMNK